jgi:hypothetical protein
MPNYLKPLIDMIPVAERDALYKSWENIPPDPRIEKARRQLCERLDIAYVAY